MNARRRGLLHVSAGWSLKIRGDVRSLGGGLMEMRMDYGPGYRNYFMRRGSSIILLLCGGDKKSQPRDIAKARELIVELDG